MVAMFHLATRSVKRAYDHQKMEAQLSGQTTSEILNGALQQGERMHAIFRDFLHTR